MLNKEDWLEKPQNETRILTKPFYKDGFKVFCDGNVFVAEPAPGEPDTDRAPGVSAYLKDDGLVFKALRVDLPEAEMCTCSECFGSGKGIRVSCRECDGLGEVEAETDYNTYDVTCKSCGGSGNLFDKRSDEVCVQCNGAGSMDMPFQPAPILDIFVQRRYLRMVCEIEDIEYALSSDHAALRWRSKSENCFGVIIPLRI